MKFECSVYFPCPVCSGEDFERLASLWSSRVNVSAPVAICRDCGFVTIRPRWDVPDYKQINRIWYPPKFAADPPTDPDEKKKFSKWETMWDRIGHDFTQAPRVLDVGAGQGWAIEFLKTKFPKLDAVAIEQWEPSQEYIRTRLMASVLDIDIEDDWPHELHDSFDLIILRHTLEHLLDPLKALKQIRACLDDRGIAYICVPDAMGRFKAGVAVRTDFFRPVHLHYFNRFTFQELTARAGLSPTALGANHEIWGSFKRAPLAERSIDGRGSYPEQRDHLKARLAETEWASRKDIVVFTLGRWANMWLPPSVVRALRRIYRWKLFRRLWFEARSGP